MWMNETLLCAQTKVFLEMQNIFIISYSLRVKNELETHGKGMKLGKESSMNIVGVLQTQFKMPPSE
jgi:hypothetical protein